MPRKRKHNPGKCEDCKTTITGAYLSFCCHTHVLCWKCSQSVIPNWSDACCPYCHGSGEADDISEALAETLLSSKTVDPPPVETPLFLNIIPKKFKLKNIMLLPSKVSCIWATPFEDRVMLGRSCKTAVDIVNIDGVMSTHEFTTGKGIHSGLCINSETILIQTHNLSQYPGVLTSVFSALLDSMNTENSTKFPLITTSSEKPIDIFPMFGKQYGVYFGDRIDVYTKKALVVQENATPKDTIKINIPDPSALCDRVCYSSENLFCVCSHNNHQVFMLDLDGNLVKTIGQKASDLYTTIAGHLWWPRSVQSCSDGSLFVTGRRGDVHLYRAGKWSVIKEAAAEWDVWHSVITASNLWILKEGQVLQIYKVKY